MQKKKVQLPDTGKCSLCGIEIDSGIVVTEAELTRKTFATRRIIDIYCEKCWKRVTRKPRGRKGFSFGYCQACNAEWRTPAPIEGCPYCGSKDFWTEKPKKQNEGKEANDERPS